MFSIEYGFSSIFDVLVNLVSYLFQVERENRVVCSVSVFFWPQVFGEFLINECKMCWTLSAKV